MKKYSFYIAGGDMRFVYLANSLAAEGYTVTAFALSGAEGLSGDVIVSGDSSEAAFSDVTVLPLPCGNKAGNLNAPFDGCETPLLQLASQLEHGSVLFHVSAQTCAVFEVACVHELIYLVGADGCEFEERFYINKVGGA